VQGMRGREGKTYPGELCDVLVEQLDATGDLQDQSSVLEVSGHVWRGKKSVCQGREGRVSGEFLKQSMRARKDVHVTWTQQVQQLELAVCAFCFTPPPPLFRFPSTNP